MHLNVESEVYFCPVGRMYWRYRKQSGAMYATLNLR